jgi:hypothetical protein
VPIVLAANASGSRAYRLATLRLAVPKPFTLAGVSSDPGGVRAEGWGEPLEYYALPVVDAAISAEEGPVRLTRPDTLWLEYRVRDADCSLGPDSVPRFTPPVRPPEGSLRDVRLFYALTTVDGFRRTGVLRLDLEAEVPDAPTGPFAFRQASDLRPGGFQLGDTLLVPRAEYDGTCSDGVRSHPLSVRFLASDASPARAYLVGTGGARRLRLEDLDGDDVLETEAWDPDGDGRFEARRALALPLPRALQSSARRAVLERQRQEVARRAAEEAARRAAVRRARADTVPPAASDTAPRPSAPPPDSVGRPPPGGRE